MAFKNSTHKFTDPIRIFKANDPYHYVIDNLPLQQLLENDRWLKDQIDSGVLDSGTGSRSSFQELRPYVTGADNVVRVNPGQFHARINDAYNKTRLQDLKLVSYITGSLRKFSNEASFSYDQLKEILRRLGSTVAADALFLNGLTEQTNFWQPTLYSGDTTSTPNAYTEGGTGNTNITTGPGSYDLPLYAKSNFTRVVSTFLDTNHLQKLSSEFVKMYRGVGRLSVVSVEEELTLEVPAFDVNDFKIRNLETGQDELLNADYRIDLVFIYSHPIDASSTTIPRYTNQSYTPQTITKPTLGLVKGAGLFTIKKPDTSNYVVNPSVISDASVTEYPEILASPADQANANNGFKSLGVHGSFPSPEDLMNMAPNIVENLESNNIQLIGQSVFPVCYVVVRKNATINAGGQPIISASDVIDIRPFFRTAELTYNERAGILMATPPLSPANTAVGVAQLDRELSNLYERVRVDFAGGGESATSKVVAGGVIWGGRKFGPEGSIRLAAKFLNGFGDNDLPFSEAPILPDWDLAHYWIMNPPSTSVSDKGQRRNDYINTYMLGRGRTFDSGTNGETLTAAEKAIGTGLFTTASPIGSISSTDSLTWYTHWCKKEILIDRSAVPWMTDYIVECELQNCIFQNHMSHESQNEWNSDDGSSAGIWVERKYDRFIIYVAWAAQPPRKLSGVPSLGISALEPRLNRDSSYFSGFVVRNSDMGLPVGSSNNNSFNTVASIGNNYSTKAPYMGACTYPSVTFKVTGFSSNNFYKTLAQGSQSAIITLR